MKRRKDEENEMQIIDVSTTEFKFQALAQQTKLILAQKFGCKHNTQTFELPSETKSLG